MERLKRVLAWSANPATLKMLYAVAVAIIVLLPFGAPDASGGP